MPIPSRRKDEDRTKFLNRCMGDSVMKKEYPDQKQRVAVCMSKATEGMSVLQAAAFAISNKPEETQGKYKYEDPKTGEVYTYSRKGTYKKNGRFLIFRGTAEDDEH